MANLNKKISTMFLLPLLVVSAIAVCGLIISNHTSITSSNRFLFSSILSGCSNYIGSWQNANSRAMENYAAMPAMKDLNISTLKNNELAGILNKTSGAVSTYFGAEEDGRLYMIGEDTEALFKSGFDARKRGWYKDASASPDHAILSDPYVDVVTGKLVISVAKRAQEGVVGADFSTDDLNNLISGLYIPGNGTAVLTYGRENRILAYKDAQLITQSLDTLNKNLSQDTANKIIESSASEELYEIQENDGRTVLSMGVKIPNSTWKLFVFIPKEYFYAFYYKTLLFLILSVMVVFAVSFFVIKYLTRSMIVNPINSVKDHLKRMSEGDISLTDHLDISTGDEIESMSHSINNFTDRQHTNIIELSNKVRESVSLANENNKLITSELGTQKSCISGVVSVIKNIHDVTNQIISVTDVTIDGIEEVHQTSNDGLSIVSETENAVRRLSDSITSTHEAVTGVAKHTEEIARLSENIKTIAEQTNLLALNAAIESARAGEHGRGFAVVADEVRSLAIKTRESTEQIQQTVDALIANMRSTLDKVEQSTEECSVTMERNNEAVGFLTNVITKIDQTSASARQITECAKAQSELISEASSHVNAINQVQSDIHSAVTTISTNTAEMEQSSENIISRLLQNREMQA